MSTGLSKDIWLKALQRVNYGFIHMSDDSFAKQQKIADIFVKARLIPEPVDVKKAQWIIKEN